MLITRNKIEKRVASGATFLKLDNGLTLIHQEIPTAAVATVDIWVQAGTINEPEEWSGMAHFLEHMIFKGTEKILPGEFDWFIESKGGVTNAATSHDYAHYMFTTAANNFSTTLPYLAEMLLHACIPDSEFEQERLVVLEEMHQALDDPDWLAYQNLMQTAYKHHPYSRSVLGEEDILVQLTSEQMRRFHRDRYRPDLMTVAVVGAVAEEEVVAVVSKAFGGIYSREASMEKRTFTVEPPLDNIRRHTARLPRLQHSRLNMAWLGPNVECLEEALQLELLSVILAEGRSSRLVKELREELGWVLDIGSNFSMQRDPGLFNISAYLDVSYLEPVEYKIQYHIAKLSETLVTDAELTRAKRSLCNSFAFGMESPNQLASFLGYYGMLGCQELCYDWSTAYNDSILRVEAEDLQRLAVKYLSPDRYIITSLIPESWLAQSIYH